MPYSVFVGVALAIHIFTNIDMFIKKDNVVAIKQFRLFLISIALFYTTDLLWGIFDESKLRTPLYVDSVIYFIMMGATIFFWTGFVIRYLEGNKLFSNILKWVGIVFFASELILITTNIFLPIMFTVDENCVYKNYVARDVMLYAQIAMYSLITIYSFIYTFRSKTKKYRRYIAISLFSIVMITCIAIQLGDPYIPFYSIGCLVGICILDTFALSDTKERFKTAYQETSVIAYIDPLTGVKSRHACVEEEIRIDRLISTHEMDDFVIIVFDLNGLKHINDTLGHEQGDNYIIESVNIIASCFPKDAIYRYGGDEFIVILEGNEIGNRQKYHAEFTKIIDANIGTDKPVIASGMSKYREDVDNTFKAVFYRADKMMYARKEHLKEMQE